MSETTTDLHSLDEPEGGVPPTLFKYIERSQTILQNSKPENDLLIYWPYYDVAAEEGQIFNHLGVNKDAGWFKNHPISELSENLLNDGYTFDYISDKQLLNCKMQNGEIVTSGNANYKAIVVPQTKYIPLCAGAPLLLPIRVNSPNMREFADI